MPRRGRPPRRTAVQRAQRVLRARRAGTAPGASTGQKLGGGVGGRPRVDAGGERPASRRARYSGPVIELRDVVKTYRVGEIEVHALRGVSLRIERGEYVAIMGASGSGKTTLMNIVGCLDEQTSGTYRLNGLDVRGIDEDTMADVRNRYIGFVFQSYNLIPRTGALANLELPLAYARVPRAERREHALRALAQVGLSHRVHHVPSELSGGQQQRVAVARALVMNPAIILADEPTGNLDSASGAEVMALFERLNQDGRTIILITHEHEVANHAHRVVRIRDGLIVADERRETVEAAL